MLTVLLFTDLVGSMDLKSRLGTQGFLGVLTRHNELFEQACREVHGTRILKHTGDGFFASCATASDAVRIALRFQEGIRAQDWGGAAVAVRIGIHAGEVASVDIGGQGDLIGLAADIAARLMQAAEPGQILMTRSPFDDARQFVSGESDEAGVKRQLSWIAHGSYLLRGLDEPVELFEVGVTGVSPLHPPADAEKARRVLRADEEQTLGWRPAVGLPLPGDEVWVLTEKLGEGGFGEVWLAKRVKTNVGRVFKFCIDAERLRALKREVALFRLMKEALGDRRDIARVIDFQFEQAPFYIELEYSRDGNLISWAERRGGIATVPMPERLKVMSQVAEAVAAAHSVGILHKDIKPSNVLMFDGADGQMHAKLTDFGIGALTDRSRLAQFNITAAGFTADMMTQNDTSRTGTRLYSAPEYLVGGPATVEGDVYSLGVMLYQMVVGDLNRPLASGWERDVPDELIREDIAQCVEGDKTRRLKSALELSERLRKLDERREARERTRLAAEMSARRRKRYRVLAVAAPVLALLLGVTLLLGVRERLSAQAAEKARLEAVAARASEEQQRKQAQMLSARATANFEVARSAVNEMLGERDEAKDKDQKDDPAERDLPPLERLRRVRLRQFNIAIGSYQEFAKQSPDDPALSYQLAKLLTRRSELRNIQQEMGQDLDEATTILRKLQAALPEKTEYQVLLVDILERRANNRLKFGDLKGGRAGLSEAMAEWEKLVKRFPADEVTQKGFAKFLEGLAATDMVNGPDYLRRAVTARSAVITPQSDRLARVDLARTAERVAELTTGAAEKKQYLQVAREQRLAVKKMSNPQLPTDAEDTLALLTVNRKLSFEVADGAGGEEAIAVELSSVDSLKELIRMYPAYPQFQEELSRLQLAIADAYCRAGKFEKALGQLKDASVRAMNLQNWSLRLMTFTRHAWVLEKLGKHDEAAEYMRQVDSKLREKTGPMGGVEKSKELSLVETNLDEMRRVTGQTPWDPSGQITRQWYSRLIGSNPAELLEIAESVAGTANDNGPWGVETEMNRKHRAVDRTFELLQLAADAKVRLRDLELSESFRPLRSDSRFAALLGDEGALRRSNQMTDRSRGTPTDPLAVTDIEAIESVEALKEVSVKGVVIDAAWGLPNGGLRIEFAGTGGRVLALANSSLREAMNIELGENPAQKLLGATVVVTGRREVTGGLNRIRFENTQQLKIVEPAPALARPSLAPGVIDVADGKALSEAKGRWVTLQGVITGFGVLGTERQVFFRGTGDSKFSALIAADDFEAFSDGSVGGATNLIGRKIVFRGKVRMIGDRPKVRLEAGTVADVSEHPTSMPTALDEMDTPIPVSELRKHEGQRGTARATIKSVDWTRNRNLLIIRVKEAHPDIFCFILRGRDKAKFDAAWGSGFEGRLINSEVIVSGRVGIYEEVVQVEWNDPGDVRFVKGGPERAAPAGGGSSDPQDGR